MIRFLTGIAIPFALLVCSCQQDDPRPEEELLPNETTLRALSDEEKLVVKSANEFSLQLFSMINASHPNENIFISPFSIGTALSMTLNGASGATLDSMKRTLQVEVLTLSELNVAYKDLVNYLLNLDKSVTLEVANSNWSRTDLTIQKNFNSTLLEYYNAEVKSADFTDPATTNVINGWVETKTNGKIKNMISGLPADLVMLLINAVYFKADWQYQFDPANTNDRLFFLEDGTYESVPTMSTGMTIQYVEKEGLRLIDIPYGNGHYRFTVVNSSIMRINEIINLFTIDELISLDSASDEMSLPVSLPKFKLEFKSSMRDVLIAMGMEIAFSAEKANFSNLFDDNTGIFLGDIIHQSVLEINEEGSEAAAATSVQSLATSDSEIKINSPFLFFIREKHSNTILFAGKVMDL